MPDVIAIDKTIWISKNVALARPSIIVYTVMDVVAAAATVAYTVIDGTFHRIHGDISAIDTNEYRLSCPKSKLYLRNLYNLVYNITSCSASPHKSKEWNSRNYQSNVHCVRKKVTP